MKNLFTILLSAAALNVAGQATLPNGWNFDDNIPVGWTESLDNNPGNTRYTNGFVNAACKLDGDDEYVEVFFSDVCGSVTYNILGSGSSQTDDIFTIQESANGSSWTTMRELVGPDLDGGAYTEYTDNPMPASRYIRWYFTEKQSGRNVGLDEITLEAQTATSAQEINVASGGNSLPNNSTFIIGNTASTAFDISNVNLAGGSDLNVSAMTITGANSGDFTISGATAPFAITAEGTQAFNIDFTASGTGSHFAALTIMNDDANGDETTYTINLYGIGGDYATEPTEAPTNLSFSDVTTYRYNVSFSDASVVPENYIVLRGIENQFMGVPTDGVSYVKGDWLDAGTQVVYVGPAGEFNPSYNMANTTYFFAAYSFNGPAGFENYYSTPTEGFVTTPATMMGNYYDGVDPTAASFMTDIQNRISNPYHQIFYSNYAPVMINKFASRDTTDGQKVITGVYSGFEYMYDGAFFYDVMSREHSWPHSWMPAFPNQDGDEYSDLHNLFPVHQNGANAVRSNKPFGNVVTQESSFGDAQYGDDSNGNRVYEPRDQHKGDAARAIFYMATKWNGTGGTWELPNPIDFIVQYGQDQDVLKQWNIQDPPDNWEIARNDFVESEQENRNPFVDHPDWACYINFENLTYIPNPTMPCATTPDAVEEQTIGTLAISPNPATNQVILDLNLNNSDKLTAVVTGLSGKILMTQQLGTASGKSRFFINVENLASGMYMLTVESKNGRMIKPLVVK